MNEHLKNAIRIASLAHRDQVRKDEPIPYIGHLIAVALILARHNFSDEVIAAGLTHDVLEDTDYLPEELRTGIGEEAYAIVTAVTNDEALPWDKKKQKYIDSVSRASELAKAVATADKIHNAESLLRAHAREGSAVWKHFNAGREKKLWFENAMLAMLQKTWKHPLVDEYAALVAKLNTLD